MKKLFVAVALIMGLGTSAAIADGVKTCANTVAVADEYTQIELNDIPQIIKDAVAKNYAGSAIKEAYVKTCEEGIKHYKLVLVNAEQTENTVCFNEKGDEIKKVAE